MPTVLVVDDAPVDRHLAEECLRQNGFDAVLAENGLRALELLDSTSPDVVLTDLIMPELDGLGLVDRMRHEYPAIPVVLMTGQGNSETALQALRVGASTYIPKNRLPQSIGETLNCVLLARKAVANKDRGWNFLSYRETHYEVGYEEKARSLLVSDFEAELARMEFCDDAELIRVGTALTEALTNAIEHGNLELDSDMKETDDQEYFDLARKRAQESPYAQRRVRIISQATPAEAKFVFRDEGPGFDHRNLPDPTDPANLLKLSGRGLLLIRTFMDEVTFNEAGNEITLIKRRRPVADNAEGDGQDDGSC